MTAHTPRWVLIQRNPNSGSGQNRQKLLDLIAGLRRNGFLPRMFRNRNRLKQWLDDEERRAGVVCLVAAGGDGTVSDVINRYPGLPIAILPMGTENLLARYLDLPQTGEGLAGLIASGSRRKLDLGWLGDRRFALMVSVGIDAEIVKRVHAARRGNISHSTYIQPILESFRTYDYPELRVTVDDEPVSRSARLVEVVNLPAYALGLPIAAGARGDDGKLDLRLFERGEAFQMVRYLCNVALGTHEQLPDVVSRLAKRVRIDADRPVPVQADGDPAGFTPVEIRLEPGALEVFAPSPDGRLLPS